MTLKFKIEYLSAIRKRYYQSAKKEKTKILNELCAVAGFNRKYAIRILAIKHHEGKKQSGRTNVFKENGLCFKKLAQILRR